MSLGRAVPWASWAEWRQVGLWLLSETPEEVQRGLDRVSGDPQSALGTPPGAMHVLE